MHNLDHTEAYNHPNMAEKLSSGAINKETTVTQILSSAVPEKSAASRIWPTGLLLDTIVVQEIILNMG